MKLIFLDPLKPFILTGPFFNVDSLNKSNLKGTSFSSNPPKKSILSTNLNPPKPSSISVTPSQQSLFFDSKKKEHNVHSSGKIMPFMFARNSGPKRGFSFKNTTNSPATHIETPREDSISPFLGEFLRQFLFPINSRNKLESSINGEKDREGSSDQNSLTTKSRNEFFTKNRPSTVFVQTTPSPIIMRGPRQEQLTELRSKGRDSSKTPSFNHLRPTQQSNKAFFIPETELVPPDRIHLSNPVEFGTRIPNKSSKMTMKFSSKSLYRMLVEMGVINLGPMRYYYSAGYGLPLVIVGLSIGVRSDQYGNYFFCWLSIYESVVWALVGPIVGLIAAILLVFFMAISASVKLSSDKALGHTKSISDTKTIKTLLFVGLLFLPILGTTWGLAVLSVSEDMEILHHFFSIMSAATSVYILIGYCLINGIARSSLVGYLTTGKPPYSKENSVTRASRTTFPYKDTFNINRRNIGISTASTTSRSTCKTSSSPYRTDGEMAMSNGNHHISSSDVNSHSVKSPYAYNDSTTFHRKNNVSTNRRPSESESELSLEQQQSMELASSHTSDDDTTVHNGRLRVNERRHQGPPVPPKPHGGVGGSSAYLPNIYDLDSTSPEDQPIGPQLMPPDLPPTTSAGIPDVTVGGMSPSLRHNIKPIYAQHWSSQLPPAFPGIYSSDGEQQSVTSPQWGVGGAGERLSTTTTSDNEVTDHGGGGDNLRVESRPLHTNYLNQRQFASPPSLPLQEGNYGTYSPKSKPRFNADIQKYTTLDHRAYSPAGGEARRYSPVVNAMGVPYTQDPKAQRSQDNLDALLRTESRASRGSQRSVDSGGRGKYSPHPLYSGGDSGGSPLVQKRYLSNLVEEAAPRRQFDEFQLQDLNNLNVHI